MLCNGTIETAGDKAVPKDGETLAKITLGFVFSQRRLISSRFQGACVRL